MNPIAFKLFGFPIRYYSLFILLGVVISYFIIQKDLKKENIDKDTIFNMFFITIIMGIIGARLYYIVFNFSYYKENILEMIQIYNGGLAIHGGIIMGLITLYIYTKKHKLNFFKITDTIAPCLLLSQALGRWGNFFNSEAYGIKTTLSHLENIHIPSFIIKGMYINGSYYTPTFFYESILCFLGFVIIVVYKKYRNNLKVSTSLYLIIYGLIRLFIERYRLDALMLFDIKVAQLVSIIMIITAIILLLTRKKTTNI